MLTGELRSKVDKLWTTFWTGGIANPLTVIEQISYLLFLKRLDDREQLAEKKAIKTGKPNPAPIFSPAQQHLRWSRFKNLEAEELFKLFTSEVFPFMKSLASTQESTFARAMKDATFEIRKPSLIADAVENPNVRFRDSLSRDNTEEGLYTLILANPPFKGSLAVDEVASGGRPRHRVLSARQRARPGAR